MNTNCARTSVSHIVNSNSAQMLSPITYSLPPWPDVSTSEVRSFPATLIQLISYSTFFTLGLPPDARAEDVSKFFDGYGRIVDCRVMTGSSSRRFIKLSSFKHSPLQDSASSSSKARGTPKMLCTTSTARTLWVPSMTWRKPLSITISHLFLAL